MWLGSRSKKGHLRNTAVFSKAEMFRGKMLRLLQKGQPSSLLMVWAPHSFSTLCSKYHPPQKKKKSSTLNRGQRWQTFFFTATKNKIKETSLSSGHRQFIHIQSFLISVVFFYRANEHNPTSSHSKHFWAFTSIQTFWLQWKTWTNCSFLLGVFPPLWIQHVTITFAWNEQINIKEAKIQS